MTESVEKIQTVKEECKEGGFVVKFETVVTLHQCALFEGEEETDSGDGSGGNDQPSAAFYWEVLQYGMPVVIANKNGVVFCLADIESGDKICEFPLWSSSQYITVDGHFHIIAEPTGCYGISFDDSTLGERVLVLLKRAMSCPSFGDEEDNLEPSAKQRRVEDDSADGSGDEVDGPFGKRPKLKQKRSLEISEPTNFEHLYHVGVDASIAQLTQAMSWTDTLKTRKRRGGEDCRIEIPVYNCKEVDTVSTTSFVAMKDMPQVSPPPPPGPAPPPPPPPPAVAPPPAKVVLKKKHSATSSTGSNDLMSSLANEIKKGVVLRPVSDRSSISSESSKTSSFDSLQEELKSGAVLKSVSSSRVMTLPPPPRRNQSEKLLFEISTFRRTKLRHVSTATNMTDSSDPGDKTLESVMKRGFDTMMKKMSGLGIPTIVHVTKGEDENFDALFTTNE